MKNNTTTTWPSYLAVTVCMGEMGCGSTKHNSSAHVASTSDLSEKYSNKTRVGSSTGGEPGWSVQEEEDMTTSSAPSTGHTEVAFKSLRDAAVCSDGALHCYSRTTGSKGNATFTVTLSHDGSLLEIETVTMGDDDGDTVSQYSSDSGNSKENCGRDVMTIAQIATSTRVPVHLSEQICDRDIYDNTNSVGLNIKNSTPYTSVHCIEADTEYSRLHTGESAIDLEDDSTCNGTGKNINCQTGQINHCTSLPNIKDRCFTGEKDRTSSLVETSGYPGNHSRQSSPVSQYRYSASVELNRGNPGGLSTHNCPSNSGSLSEGSGHLANSNLQTTPSNRAFVNDGLQSNANSSPCVQNMLGDSQSKYLEKGNGSGNVLKGSAVAVDYTCLGYCARKCYNNPSLPRLSSRTFAAGAKDSPRPMVASYSFCIESNNTPPEKTMVYSSSESANRGANLGINLPHSANSTTISSANRKNSAEIKRAIQKQSHSRQQLHDSPSSGLFAFSAFLSRSLSSPRQQSPMHLTDTCSLTPKAKNKSCLRLVKNKALSEDVPCVVGSSHYVRQSTSFNGQPPASYCHNDSSGDEQMQDQSNLNNCDVSYVHQDFFNDFEDFNDDDDQS